MIPSTSAASPQSFVAKAQLQHDLIIGGAGSIGSELAKTLADRGGLVTVFDRSEARLFDLKTENHVGLQLQIGDMRDIHQVRASLVKYKPSTVYLLAAVKHVSFCNQNYRHTIDTNITGIINVVEACYEFGIPTLVYVSSDKAVYPTSIYGASKLIAEHIVLDHGYTVIRLPNVFGTRGGVEEKWLKQVEAGEPITVVPKGVTRFYLPNEDVARLIIKASEDQYHGKLLVPKKSEQWEITLLAETRHFGYPRRTIPLGPGEKTVEDLVTKIEDEKKILDEHFWVIIP